MHIYYITTLEFKGELQVKCFIVAANVFAFAKTQHPTRTSQLLQIFPSQYFCRDFPVTKRDRISFAGLFWHCPLRSMLYAFQIKCIDFRGLHSVGQTIKLKLTDMKLMMLCLHC